MNRFLVTLVLVTVSFVLLYAKPPANGKGDKTVAGGLFCDICKLLVVGLETVPEGEEEQYLENEIDRLCSHLGFFAHFCNVTLFDIGETLIQAVHSGVTPDLACATVDLCDAPHNQTH